MSTLVPSLTWNLKVFTSTLIAVAFVLTVYRVICRCATHRFWWEDACVAVALIGSIICVVSSWTQFELIGQPAVISSWIYAFAYPSVVWLARLSILLSVLRITLPLRSLRQAILLIAGLFVMIWLSLMIAVVVNHGEWTQQIAVFELINIVSDCLLISLPIRPLRSIKLPRSQLRLIIIAFSLNIAVIIVCIFRAACQVLNISTLISVAIEIEVACSLFASNSLFLTTLIYRMLHRNDVAIDAESNTRGAAQFTTHLDLGDSLGSIVGGRISFPVPTTTYPNGDMEKHEDILS